jgi:uncharacterized lipoprotein
MKYHYLLAILLVIPLSACSERPLIYFHDDEKNSRQDVSGTYGGGEVAPREPLDVPPELRDEVSLPSDSSSNQLPVKEKEYVSSVAGKAVALDARLYNRPSADVFSAVVDAMTALNLPVQSVDSMSGTITTDWVRKGSDNPNFMAGALGGIFGGGPTFTRYRFVVRIFPEDSQTRLEIRTLAQAFINKHWVNKPLKH